MIFIFLVPTLTSPVINLDFFSENTLGDGPKNSRIRVNNPKMNHLRGKALDSTLYIEVFIIKINYLFYVKYISFVQVV